MNSEVEIVPLNRGPREIVRFLETSYVIYSEDPHWVAPLLIDMKKVFTDANPLFGHAEMQLWLARRGGRDVGRVAGVIDRTYNSKPSNPPSAFFGFFECVNDPAVSGRLLGTVKAWARSRGMRRILGPMNPTANDECGLLVRGYDGPPVFMMSYNPAYYAPLIEASGFGKAKDLLAFHLDLARCPLERIGRIAQRAEARWPEVSIRPIRRRTLMSDITRIKEVYNEAWEDNWGFTPMTDAEVDFMARRLKPLFTEGLAYLAETRSEPVGFLLAIPDYNVALQPLRGRLLTPRLLGFLPYLLGWKHPPRARVITLGVKKSHRNKGLESAMLIRGLGVGFKIGFTEAEASWILEDNQMMCRVMETLGATPYRAYRLYELSL